MPGRLLMGQQQGVQARDLRHDQQQPGAGVQQPGMQPLGIQRPVLREQGQQQQQSQAQGPAQPRPEA